MQCCLEQLLQQLAFREFWITCCLHFLKYYPERQQVTLHQTVNFKRKILSIILQKLVDVFSEPAVCNELGNFWCSIRRNSFTRNRKSNHFIRNKITFPFQCFQTMNLFFLTQKVQSRLLEKAVKVTTAFNLQGSSASRKEWMDRLGNKKQAHWKMLNVVLPKELTEETVH